MVSLVTTLQPTGRRWLTQGIGVSLTFAVLGLLLGLSLKERKL